MKDELVKWEIDNSHNPPIRDIYCGMCDRYVESIYMFEEIPFKKDVLCWECQDKLDKNNDE